MHFQSFIILILKVRPCVLRLYLRHIRFMCECPVARLWISQFLTNRLFEWLFASVYRVFLPILLCLGSIIDTYPTSFISCPLKHSFLYSAKTRPFLTSSLKHFINTLLAWVIKWFRVQLAISTRKFLKTKTNCTNNRTSASVIFEKFSGAYLFQIAQNSFDYYLILHVHFNFNGLHPI